MKKTLFFLLFFALGAAAYAQTISFVLTTTPCHDDGVLTSNYSGLTPPLTVSYYTSGLSGAVITHTVTGTTDALTGYSGGSISEYVTDATSAFAYNSYSAPHLLTASLLHLQFALH